MKSLEQLQEEAWVELLKPGGSWDELLKPGGRRQSVDRAVAHVYRELTSESLIPSAEDFHRAYDDAMRMSSTEGNFRGGWEACVRWQNPKRAPADPRVEAVIAVLEPYRLHSATPEKTREVVQAMLAAADAAQTGGAK